MTKIPKPLIIERLQMLCQQEGLHLLGLVSLEEETKDFERLENWLARGWNASMGFLGKYLDLRRDPRGILPGAGSAIILALPYDLGDRYGQKSFKPRIAQYARYRDYHKTIQKHGRQLIQSLKEQGEPYDQALYRVVVDSAPVMERALAARTAKGFIGKNTCYIHPEEGSFLLLGAILTSLDLSPDQPVAVPPDQRQPGLGGCGTCQRCQVNCPTGALDEAYKLDANRCLAYWTIEHRGTIPFEFWPWLTKYWFGCDICQLVCPYNRSPEIPESRRQLARRDLESLDLFAVATMSQGEYESWFGGTPLTRAKRSGLRRNALIVLAVQQDPRLAKALAQVVEIDEQVLHQTLKQILSYSTTCMT